MLKLMYITNDPEIASIADRAGVDRIFIDLEQYGKEKRQKNWDSVKSKHSISDIPKMKTAVRNAQIFVRTDPILTAFRMNSKAYSPASLMLSCCRISKPSAKSRLL